MDAAVVLKEARTRSGMSQAQLAKAAGTTQAMVARYESGATSPTVRALTRLLDACGMRAEVRLRTVSDLVAPPVDVAVSWDRVAPTLAMLRERKADIERIVAEHGGSNVAVFGSVARGEADDRSDVDFLIDYDEQASGPLAILAMCTELERELGVRVDVVPRALLRASVAPSALDDAVAL